MSTNCSDPLMSIFEIAADGAEDHEVEEAANNAQIRFVKGKARGISLDMKRQILEVRMPQADRNYGEEAPTLILTSPDDLSFRMCGYVIPDFNKDKEILTIGHLDYLPDQETNSFPWTGGTEFNKDLTVFIFPES